VEKTPLAEEKPSLTKLRELQGFSGEFNWLATRTRPDISYYTSLLASASTRHASWSEELARKILRFLAGTKHQGILISCDGDLSELIGWSDAGYAGAETKSQNGLIITWGGSIIVWRSSKQTISTLSTAEAELNAAALAWQIVEGLRLLLEDLGILLPSVHVMIDNQAAITIAENGPNWRTRYFGVRGHRLQEESQAGRAEIMHCPTKDMLADALTKLASVGVIEILHAAMNGAMPPVVGQKVHLQATLSQSSEHENNIVARVSKPRVCAVRIDLASFYAHVQKKQGNNQDVHAREAQAYRTP